MRKKSILYVLIILFFVGAAIVFYAYREFFRKAEDVSTVQSAYQRSAIELIQEFKSNEQASNTLYLGKVLSVSGMVKSVESSDGTFTISLGDTTDLSSVRCTLDSLHGAEAGGLRIGSSIAVKGYCSGFNADEMLGSDVILNRCALEMINEKK